MTTVGCSQGVGFLGAQATPNHPSTAAALTSVTKHTEVIRLPRAFLEPNSTDLRLGVLGASEQPPHMVGGGRVPQRQLSAWTALWALAPPHTERA